jgi:DNA-binding beta-propeller fold protein YncE
MMRRKRILFGLVLALTASTAPAKAAPDDPYLIYVANRQVAKGQSQWPVILRADAATGALSELSRNGRQGNLFVHPYDLAVEHDGSLIVADMGQFASDDPTPDGAIIRVDPRNGTQSLVSQGGALVDPAGVAVASDGALYVLENVGVGGLRGVIRIDPLTGAQTGVARGGELCNPFGIAFDPRGDLVVADYGTLVLSNRPIVECPRATGSLVRIERSTGRQAVLAEGNLLRNPLGIAIEPGGRILVANESVNAAAALVAVDPVSGEQSVVASNTGGDLFRLPERIALAPDGRLLVTDFELTDRFGGIVGVAPGDGAQTTGWQGELFNNPLGLAVVVNRPPTATLTASPATVAGGQPVRFDASGSGDPEGLSLRYDWDLDGDGAFERRTLAPSLSRPYADSRALTAQVRVSDPHQASATASAPLTVDATPPLVGAFAASARTLLGRKPSRRRGAGSAAARPRRATTFRYALSEPAAMAIRIERALPGRRVRGSCRAPGRRAVPRRARCTRRRLVVVLHQQAAAGANVLRFACRVHGKRLVSGHYRATAEAGDVVGNRSQPKTIRLRVVSPRRRVG